MAKINYSANRLKNLPPAYLNKAEKYHKMDKRTEEILTRFEKSWTETERFYDNLIIENSGFERLKPIRQFISDLRQNGNNKYFRLGTSIYFLIISRSVNYGLRPDQKYIKIEAVGNTFEVTFQDETKIYRAYMVDDLSEYRVEKLLKTLKSTLVD